jgi:hypothetical protein
MMKRIVLSLLLVGLLAAPAMSGGVKRMQDYTSYLDIDLLNADTATESISKIPITFVDGPDKSYNLIMGCLYSGNATVTGGAAAADSLGSLDTIIINVITGWGVLQDTLKCDTLIPPDTC